MADASDAVAAELAPTGVLRAGVNMGNILLVTGTNAAGDPVGVAPDLAREIASRLGLPIRFVTFARPGDLADAATDGVWDIGLIGAEPARAEKIAFTAAYAEIEANPAALPDSDYTATCANGNRYHVFVDANGRGVVQKL